MVCLNTWSVLSLIPAAFTDSSPSIKFVIRFNAVRGKREEDRYWACMETRHARRLLDPTHPPEKGILQRTIRGGQYAAPHRRFLESDGGSQPENGSIPNRRARIVRIGRIAARMNDILEEGLHSQPLRNLRLVCDFNHSLVV